MSSAYDTRISIVRSESYIKEFAEHFVHDIIDEALKQSSKTTWLIHCSESCHKLNSLCVDKLNSYICWTPERNKILHNNVDEILKLKGTSCARRFPCRSVVVQHRENELGYHDLYTLPVDSIRTTKSNKSITNEDKCLKPKAVHALNVLRSSHQKTFSDIKLFLINLYSSGHITPKKIGSENSAFTKYCYQNPRNGARNAETVATTADDRIKRKPKNQGKSLRVVHMKTDTDLKNIRKCNRIKRCTLLNIKHSFCNVFKWHKTANRDDSINESYFVSFKDRSLPPLPLQRACACPCENSENLLRKTRPTNCGSASAEYEDKTGFNYEDEYLDEECMHRNKAFDFAANIEKVKDYGWYWGPMSSEAAEKLLEKEKDGSFIVRDSSDDRYIFSLTFKLNACIRHVRIDHGEGNFSFGNYTKFKSHTIVDFIENAVQHSRSGRYLFFLHRRPMLGPMRVQLLYPVSRFRHVQSLQHMCRFVILKSVRRDLITSLPLPKAMIEYLSSKDYYAEQRL